MFRINSISDPTLLNEFKQQYFAQATAPLDGMWHCGFVPMAEHIGLYENNNLIGYYVINNDGYLLQFHLSAKASTKIKEAFRQIVEHENSEITTVKGAFVSTAEPQYLSLCMDISPSFKVNALMYQQHNKGAKDKIESIDMALATAVQLNDCVEFAMAAIGAPKAWLTGYFSNLINRQELWAYLQDGKVIATGECRRFDEYQIGYADIGMIVAQQARGKGLATRIINFLVKHANSQHLKAICSTEQDNIAAQKAIEKAGFIGENRIVQFDF